MGDWYQVERSRDINFFRKKTQMFQIFGNLDITYWGKLSEECVLEFRKLITVIGWKEASILELFLVHLKFLLPKARQGYSLLIKN